MCRLELFLLISVFLMIKNVQGYTYRGLKDTSDDFCDLEEQGFGKVETGSVGYNDERCEEVRCYDNGYTIDGCSKMLYDEEICELTREEGHYPDCCPKVHCPSSNEVQD